MRAPDYDFENWISLQFDSSLEEQQQQQQQGGNFMELDYIGLIFYKYP